MFIIEDYPYWNPNYHTPNDTLDTLNLAFHADVTRSLVAAIAFMAGVVPNEEDIDNDGIPNNDDNCPYTPNLNQVDTYPPEGNDIGDVCDCEGNFDCDSDCDGSDAVLFKTDFGRSSFNTPCESNNICNGDFDCDNDCDGVDAALFKQDFGRGQLNNPCPLCIVGVWCVY